MIDYSDVRIFLCTTPTKMNYSFDRLMGRAQEVFNQDPTSGHLFLFLNRDRDRIKILFWDRDGFCIWYKRLERVVTTMGDMDGTSLPHDLTECHRLLLAAFKQSVQLERQVADADQRAAQSEQQTAELSRVLDETAASYQTLQQEHAATLDELAWFKRWMFGRRRERFTEGEGQGHLFELDSPAVDDEDESVPPETETDVKGHRRRKNRKIDWDKLRQIHHEHDLQDAEKVCSCCGQPLDRIGEDVTRELEYQPPKLEAHIHTRPKYACRRCQNGVAAAAMPARPIPGGIAGPGLITEVYVGKFSDHLPLYRLEDILARYGVYISRSTLCS